MKSEAADRLYSACREIVKDTNGSADDLYNILEGHALDYLDEVEN